MADYRRLFANIFMLDNLRAILSLSGDNILPDYIHNQLCFVYEVRILRCQNQTSVITNFGYNEVVIVVLSTS